MSVPTVAADGRIYVAFLNTTDLTTGRDDYEVVEVSPATGARLAGPFKVAHRDRRRHRLSDRARPADLPGQHLPHLGGRQHHGRPDQRRRTSPSSGRTCATSPLPAPSRPVRRDDELRRHRQPVVRPRRGPGRAPVALALAGDQFMPWGAFDSARRSADRHVRPQRRRRQPHVRLLAGHRDGARLAVVRAAPVSTVRSDPTRGDRWFAAHARPGVPVRDVVPRRLLATSRRPRLRRRRRVLDGHAQRGLLRRRAAGTARTRTSRPLRNRAAAGVRRARPATGGLFPFSGAGAATCHDARRDRPGPSDRIHNLYVNGNVR